MDYRAQNQRRLRSDVRRIEESDMCGREVGDWREVLWKGGWEREG